MSNPPNNRERLWTPLFVLIIGVSLCAFLVCQGLNAGTSVYVAGYGGTATFAGVLATVFSAASGTVRILSGPFIDKAGRRPFMLAGAIALAIGTFGPALTHATAPFVAFRLLQGAGFGTMTAAAATAAADVLPASRLGEGIGYFGLGQALAMSIGPALALALVATDPAENLFLGMTALVALGLVCALLCRYEAHPEVLPATSAYRLRREAGEPGEARPTKAAPTAPGAPAPRGWRRFIEVRALPGMVPMLLISPAFGFSIFFMGLYGTSLGLSGTGLYYTITALAMIAVRLTSSNLIDRVAPVRLFAVAVGCGAAAYAMMLACGTLLAGEPACMAVFLAAGVPYGVCMGFAIPVCQTVALRCTPPERWGAATALYQIAPDIGNSVSAIVWGILNDAFGFPVTICCVIACIAASLGAAGALFPKGAPGRND